jgi:hypothetical protein
VSGLGVCFEMIVRDDCIVQMHGDYCVESVPLMDGLVSVFQQVLICTFSLFYLPVGVFRRDWVSCGLYSLPLSVSIVIYTITSLAGSHRQSSRYTSIYSVAHGPV